MSYPDLVIHKRIRKCFSPSLAFIGAGKWLFLLFVKIRDRKKRGRENMDRFPPSHHSPNIPGLNMQNGWRVIPYYQQFLEFPRHFFIGFQSYLLRLIHRL